MDSGRRSGHGRVVYLYYELCAKIWGGNPSTTQMNDGVETEDINNSQDLETDEVIDQSTATVSPAASSQASNSETSGDCDSHSSCEPPETSSESDESHLLWRKRREKFDTMLASHKQKKMKQKVSADSQILCFAEKELQLKERMMDRLDMMSKDHRDTMSALTNNLKSLSDTMTSAFTLLQQSLVHPNQPPQYYSPYVNPYAPPPPSPLSGSSGMYHQSFHGSTMPPLPPVSSQSSVYYSQVFNNTDDD